MSPIVELLLKQRGVEDFEKFLYPSLRDLADPETLPGVAEAAEIILKSVKAQEQIVVFGDYDCDGICATAIMMLTLRALGAKGEAFLPKRLTEGYGMSDASVERLLKEHPQVQLVITVDNGINSVSQVEFLKSRGVAVVVTDHHLPGETLPAAMAVVNPKVVSPKSLENICGAAVAYMLANQIMKTAKARGDYEGANIGGPLLVLAGLATVTDIMPLLGQNRILVAEALRRFGKWAPLGLKELHQRAARTGFDRLTAKDFSFVLGPRINAAGRLASGEEALELVTTLDREISRECARIVDGYNVDRKNIELRMTEAAIAKIVEGAPAQVIDLPDGHPGVAGIVAARIMERLGSTQPVCVLASGHGSARAPDGFNIRDAFVACDEVLERYGGHAAAGGFSVKDNRVDDFRRLLCEYVAKFDLQTSTKQRFEPDLWLEKADITLELVDELAKLEPYGEANREPVFGFRQAMLTDVKPLGQDGRHLTLEANGLKAIWWNHGDLVESLRAGDPVRDVGFTIEANDYGERHVELRLQHIF